MAKNIKNGHLQNIINKINRILLNDVDQAEKKESNITPLVESLSGVISLDDDFDATDAYADYLIEKHK